MFALMLALSLAAPAKPAPGVTGVPPPTWQMVGVDASLAWKYVGNQLDVRYGIVLATDRDCLKYIYKGPDPHTYTVYYDIVVVLHERLKAEGVIVDNVRRVEQFYRVDFALYGGNWYASPELSVLGLP